MNDRRKNIILGVLILGILTMTVVYASLSSTLNIHGSATVQNMDSSWNIHFAHITNTNNEVSTTGYAEAKSDSITLTSTTVTAPDVTLRSPGDKVEYIFKVVNEGDITGYITELNNIGVGRIVYDASETLTQAQRDSFQNDIQVTLTYNDQNKTALSYNDSLAKNEEAELLLTVQYAQRSGQVIPTHDVMFTGVSASITYSQNTTSNSGNGSSPSSPEIVNPAPSKPTMAEMCPGCVFAKYTSSHNIQSNGSTPNTLDDVTPTNDYTTLNSNYFLGHVLSNGYITRSFACGIENGEAFCLEGYDTSKYSTNQTILKQFFPNCNVDEQVGSQSFVRCYDSSLFNAYAYSNGRVGVSGTISTTCHVDFNGNSFCY